MASEDTLRNPKPEWKKRVGDYKFKASLGLQVIVKSGMHDFILDGTYFVKVIPKQGRQTGKSTNLLNYPEKYHINYFCRKLVKLEKNKVK